MLADQLRGQDKITYVASKQNLGYGGGNNLGADHAAGRYLLFLNPDVILKSDIVNQLSAYLDAHPQIGAVAPTLLHTNGQRFEKQGSGKLTIWTYLMSHTVIHRLWPHNPVARQHYLLNIDHPDSQLLAAIPGCAFMISQELFKKIGRFDESLFLYFEEWDVGKRIREAGRQLAILSDAFVEHDQAEVSRQSETQLKKIYRQSRFKYFKKYYGFIGALFGEALFHLADWRFLVLLTVASIMVVILQMIG